MHSPSNDGIPVPGPPGQRSMLKRFRYSPPGVRFELVKYAGEPAPPGWETVSESPWGHAIIPTPLQATPATELIQPPANKKESDPIEAVANDATRGIEEQLLERRPSTPGTGADHVLPFQLAKLSAGTDPTCVKYPPAHSSGPEPESNVVNEETASKEEIPGVKAPMRCQPAPSQHSTEWTENRSMADT